MPSYYNKSSRSRSIKNDDFSPEEFFSDEDFEQQSKEVRKIKVKYLKTATDKTHLEIAEELQCSTSTVKNLWAEIREEDAFELEQLADREVRKQLREYEYIKIELFEAWRESREALKKTKTEWGNRGDDEIAIEKEEIIERLPDVSYLSEIRQINSEIAKLLGIVKMAEINFNQQNNEINVVGSGPSMVPDGFDAFTKKPKELPEGSFTSIDDAPDEDEVDVGELDPGDEIDSIE